MVLFSLSKSISNDQMVRKIIRALSKSWEVKATTLKEYNDKEKITFMGNLKTDEMEIKAKENRSLKKMGCLIQALS